MEWEAAEHRVVVPLHLQLALGLETAVLRWSRIKHAKVIRDHRQQTEQEQREQMGLCLDSWTWTGSQPGRENVWRVFYCVAGRWGLVVIGRDQNGSTNVVTMYSPKNPNSLPNMIARGNYAKRNE